MSKGHKTKNRTKTEYAIVNSVLQIMEEMMCVTFVLSITGKCVTMIRSSTYQADYILFRKYTSKNWLVINCCIIYILSHSLDLCLYINKFISAECSTGRSRSLSPRLASPDRVQIVWVPDPSSFLAHAERRKEGSGQMTYTNAGHGMLTAT